MPNYRVKTGKTFGPGGRYPAGTILELTEAEAKGFEDKLERAADTALPGSTQEIVPDEPVQFKNELNVEVPDDLKLLHEEPKDEAEEKDEELEEKLASKPRKSHRKQATED